MILGAIVGALGVVAVAGFLLRDSSGSEGDGAATDTLLVCVNDGEAFTLTPAQYAEQLRSSPETAGSPDQMRGQIPRVRCPKCGQASAVPGVRCPKDQTPVASATKDGRPPRCPKCGGNPFEAR